MTTLTAVFCCFENELKKSCVLCWKSISIYKINRTLHGHLGIRILSSCAESISHLFASLTRERYLALEDKIRIPMQPCNILYVSHIGRFISQIKSLLGQNLNFSYNVLSFWSGGVGVGVGLVKKRESPDFRSPEVGISASPGP